MTNENVEFVEVDNVSEFNSLNELSQQFIKNPKVGEKIEIKCKGFKIVKSKDELEFSFEKNGKTKTASNCLSNVDYGIQLRSETGAIYWVNSWAVWGMLKAIARKLGSNSLAGIEFQIEHTANGMLEENRAKCWVVRTKVDGEWKSLNQDTNSWE